MGTGLAQSSGDSSTSTRSLFRNALLLALTVLVLDQLTKWAILAVVMQPPRVVEVLPFFNLVLTFNRGVSFGMFSGASVWQPWVLSGLSVVIVVGLLFWLRGQTRWLPALSIGLIVGGAIGNVVDRLHIGAVVDFLDVHAFGWHWPAFNVADSGITVGVVLLVLDGLFWDREHGK